MLLKCKFLLFVFRKNESVRIAKLNIDEKYFREEFSEMEAVKVKFTSMCYIAL